MSITFFVGVVSIMVVFLYGCIGEIITEKSGHLNLGTPGIMCFGATGAIVGARIFINISGGPDAVAAGGGSPVLGVFLLVLFCMIGCFLPLLISATCQMHRLPAALPSFRRLPRRH